jgi:hypothetical protein
VRLGFLVKPRKHRVYLNVIIRWANSPVTVPQVNAKSLTVIAASDPPFWPTFPGSRGLRRQDRRVERFGQR